MTYKISLEETDLEKLEKDINLIMENNTIVAVELVALYKKLKALEDEVLK